MDEPTRRAWSSPELIVLVRGRPEEAVLTTCKLKRTDHKGVLTYVQGLVSCARRTRCRDPPTP